MIDLNVRLENSLSRDDLKLLAKNAGINFDEDFIKSLTYKDKEGYFAYREKILSLLNSEENITKAVELVLSHFYINHYYYLELAFTPYLLKNCALSLRRKIKALMNGINDYLKDHSEMEVNVILYSHRNDSLDNNRQIVDLALEYKDLGIKAVGLEGEDKSRPLSNYENLFYAAKAINYPVVIELGNYYRNNHSILKAIEMGAKRLIAPYGYVFNKNDNELLIKNGITFEYRPHLDILLGLNKENNIPLKSIWLNGLKGYISGGNHSIEEEYQYLKDYDLIDVQHILNELINASFINSIHQKSVLMQHVIGYSALYFEKINKTILDNNLRNYIDFDCDK